MDRLRETQTSITRDNYFSFAESGDICLLTINFHSWSRQ